jgi:hypothetical protein
MKNKKYRIENNDREFLIREIKSDNVIGILSKKSEAHTLCASLNKRSAFCGFTPNFILERKYNVKS